MSRGAFRVEHPVGPDGLVVLRVRDGDIRIRGVERDTAIVEARDGEAAASLTVERGTASLTITAGPGVATPDLDLDVPVGATVLIEASSSDIKAKGLTGQQRYHTTSGDVELGDVAGDLSVEAVSGDLAIVAVGPASIAARTVSGDLTVRGTVLSTLRASTTSGDLSIDTAVVGDGPFTVETVSGDADLRSRGPVRVETTTLTGSISSDGDVAAEGPENARILVAGRGGPTLRFRSTSGDFHLDARGSRAAATNADVPALPAPATAAPASDAAMPGTEDLALAVLQALERGEIDPAEAARRLDAQGDRS